jgi:copper transport protein
MTRPFRASPPRALPRLGALTGLLGALLVALVALAGPASAHAILEQSNPVDSSALSAPPKQVTLGFSESVTINSSSVQVVDAGGHRVDVGGARHGAQDSAVVIGLRPDLPRGTYIVSWRVISADSHPVSGGFFFGIGEAPDSAAAAKLARSGGAATSVSYTAGALRFLQFAGLALLIGTAFFALALWPAGRSSTSTDRPLGPRTLGPRTLGPRTLDLRTLGLRRALWTGWALTFVSTGLLILIQAPYSSGAGLTKIFASGPLSEVVHSRFGHLLLLRMLALALAVPLLLRALPGLAPMPAAPGGGDTDAEANANARPEPGDLGRGGQLELGALGLVVLLTVASAGHADAGPQTLLATVITMAHIAVASIWLGGLVALGLFLWAAAAPADGPELATVLTRWSRTAMISVGLLVASGLYQTWREVGTLAALPNTSYGKVLLVKLWLFALMAWLGWLNHRWVTRRRRLVVHALSATADTVTGPPGPPPTDGRNDLSVLRRGAAFEAAAGLAVLAVAAVLVNGVPARTSYAPPLKTTVQAGPLRAKVDVTPTTRGPETLRVTTTDSHGRPVTLGAALAELSLPSANLGPLSTPLTRIGPGQFGTNSLQAPLPGVWQLRLTLRIDDFDQYVTTVFYTVRN